MAGNGDNLQSQVEELQGQLAFQEDALSTLDSALAAQQQEILLLRRQVELLLERHRALEVRYETGDAGAPAQEKPPHY